MLNVNLDPSSDFLLSPEPYPDLMTKIWRKKLKLIQKCLPKNANNNLQAQEEPLKVKILAVQKVNIYFFMYHFSLYLKL